MSKISEVKVAPTGKNPGSFKLGRFNLFNDEHVRVYEELRTKGADRSSGITLGPIREFTRAVTTTDADGQTTRSEDLYVLMEYYEKPIGESISNATELAESKLPREWYLERGPNR
jgi:hypothetical protein